MSRAEFLFLLVCVVGSFGMVFLRIGWDALAASSWGGRFRDWRARRKTDRYIRRLARGIRQWPDLPPGRSRHWR